MYILATAAAVVYECDRTQLEAAGVIIHGLVCVYTES